MGLGCGARAVFVPPDLRAALKAAGLGLEVVDTGSACRIYNVLLAEGDQELLRDGLVLPRAGGRGRQERPGRAAEHPPDPNAFHDQSLS